MKRFSIALVCLFFTIANFAFCGEKNEIQSAETSYQIKLFRPLRVGQKHQISVKATQKTSMPDNNGNMTDAAYSVTFTGIETVINLSPENLPHKISYIVDSFGIKHGEKLVPLLPAGKTINVSIKNGIKTYQIDGQGVSIELYRLLDMVLIVPSIEDLMDDKVFGSLQRRKIGEKWKPDMDAAFDRIKNDQMLPLEKGEVKGEVSLDSVDKQKNLLSISHHVIAVVKDKVINEGIKVGAFKAEQRFTAKYPTDPELQPVYRKRSVSMNVTDMQAGDSSKEITSKASYSFELSVIEARKQIEPGEKPRTDDDAKTSSSLSNKNETPSTQSNSKNREEDNVKKD